MASTEMSKEQSRKLSGSNHELSRVAKSAATNKSNGIDCDSLDFPTER